ncbi:hypothetical protein AB0F13_12470 [Streptomyces sp. NPDC026206]|uniref:hypothetical protein n=1 Tax=Streptomyces sp. NPDC026206 TaxID=3157089 RepID=UPI0033EACA37
MSPLSAPSPVDITASDFGQFGEPGGTFALITDEAGREAIRCRPGKGYERVLHLALPPGQSVQELLAEQVPPDAHVLVACPGRFLGSAGAIEPGARRLSVLPAGSTPLTGGHVRYFLQSAARTDVGRQEAAAEEFFEHAAASERLLITDDTTGSEAEFDHGVGECVWNQQAGVLGPGEQQIFPAGKLSVTAAEITVFSPEARLGGLNGTLTLRGWPIVHRHADPADEADQRRLFEALAPLVSHAVLLEVSGGTIGRVTPADPADPAARPAAEALDALLAAEPLYRTIWELGFGINTGTEVIPANCGPNEVYGARHGVLNLGIGVTPATRFALAFLCPRSSLLTADGTPVLGARKAVRRGRLQRVSSASCGCH